MLTNSHTPLSSNCAPTNNTLHINFEEKTVHFQELIKCCSYTNDIQNRKDQKEIGVLLGNDSVREEYTQTESTPWDKNAILKLTKSKEFSF